MSLLLALLMIISTSLSAIAAEADIGMPFTDVEDGAWYAAAICWAVENGVVNGYGDGSFRPNDPVTREQLAVMLYRNAQTQGQGFRGAWMFLLDYLDAGDISEWADEAMHWDVMHEIITATDGKLNPQAYVTEDELSSVLQRWEDAVKIKEIDYLALVNKLNPLSYGWEDVLETVTVTNSVGDEVEVGERYTGMTDAFDAEMQKTVLKIGEENQIPVHSGVFMEVTGPQFETPAEIKMYRSFGADAIAMSLADEVLAARQMNMKVCAINCISNMGAGLEEEGFSQNTIEDAPVA